MSKRRHDFERGYFCAVACLLRETEVANTYVRSLFSQGGDPTKADAFDQELFAAHGLMKFCAASAAELEGNKK